MPKVDPKEHFTTHLFEDIFNKVLFHEANFFVNSQQPPVSKKGSEKACDIAINYVTDTFDRQIFCFVEAKRASNIIHSKIQSLEEQALTYCLEFLAANPDATMVFACTLVGASIRCWSVQADAPELKGFWDGGDVGSFDFYKDVGDEAHRGLLERIFNFMKTMPVGTMPLGLPSSSIGQQLS